MTEKELKEIFDYISFDPPEQILKYSFIFADYDENWISSFDYDRILDFYMIEPSYKERFIKEAEAISRDPRLSKACFFFYRYLYFTESKDYLKFWNFKSEGAFSEHGSFTLPVVALLSGQPIHEDEMLKRNFDEKQTEIHKSAVKNIWKSECEKKGVDGMGFSMLMWASIFMRARIVRLGRLQYEIGLKSYPELNEKLGGNCAFAYIHIPGGESLSKDLVESSIAEAKTILPKYYPELSGKTLVFVTNTWLLSPELRETLNEGSNILSFQNRFTIEKLYPARDSFLKYCFGALGGNSSVDIESLPEDTSIRKALKKKLLSGEELHQALGWFK